MLNNVNVINDKVPAYLECIKFPYRKLDVKLCKEEIQAWRDEQKLKITDKGNYINSLMKKMVEDIGYVDYDKVMTAWSKILEMATKQTHKVEVYYTQIADLAVKEDTGKLIGVQAGTGKLIPLHKKIDELLGYTDFSYKDLDKGMEVD